MTNRLLCTIKKNFNEESCELERILRELRSFKEPMEVAIAVQLSLERPCKSLPPFNEHTEGVFLVGPERKMFRRSMSSFDAKRTGLTLAMAEMLGKPASCNLMVDGKIAAVLIALVYVWSIKTIGEARELAGKLNVFALRNEIECPEASYNALMAFSSQ